MSIVAIVQPGGIMDRAKEAVTKYQTATEEETERLLQLERLVNGDLNNKFNFKVEQVHDDNPGQMEGTGTKEDPFVINSIEDLIAFSDEVNNGNSFIDDNGKAQYVQLGQTLDFASNKSYVLEETMDYTSAYGFNSIGGLDTQFSGNFDGNKGAILNMKINQDTIAGLFGAVANATDEMIYIKNITVTGSVKATSVGNISCAAGLIGLCNGNISIENCNSAVNVVSDAKNDAIGIVAGIVGGVEGSEQLNITSCINVGNVTSGKTIFGGTGGIIGLILGAEQITIKECQNTGYIEGTGVYYNGAGGIVGATLCENMIISKCTNSGNTYAKSSSSEEGLVGSGGIIGGCLNLYTSVDNCSNSGNCTSKGNVAGASGGIVGGAMMMEQEIIIKNCSNIGNSSDTSLQYSGAGGIFGGNIAADGGIVQIESCSSVSQNEAEGNTVTGQGGVIGGIISDSSYEITVKNCYYSDNQEIMGYSDSEIINISNCYAMPSNKSYLETIVELNSYLQSDWLNWRPSKKGYPILSNSELETSSKDNNYYVIYRTENLSNLSVSCTPEFYNGLDKCFITIKPSQYYDTPQTTEDFLKYLSEEEKWQILIDLYNSYQGTEIQTKEELFEAAGVASEEEVFEQLQIDSVDGIYELAEAYGVNVLNLVLTDEFIESYNEKVNGIYKGLYVVCESSGCIEEYSNDYGYAIYSVEKNDSYTFSIYNNGTKLATKTISVNNCLEWSDAYNETQLYTDSNGNTAIIPAGFMVTTTNGYNLVNSGLLVKDSYGNTFVWVPCSSIPEALYRSFDSYDDMTAPYPVDISSTEYLQMKNSVSTNGGFYVGRYETSLIDGKAASVRTYADNTIHGGTWQELYEIQKLLYNDNEYVKSAMMWGGQYSVIYDLTSETANTRKIGATGLQLSNEQFHMYDLYENLREVSQSILADNSVSTDAESKRITNYYTNYHVAYGACSEHRKNEHIRFTDNDLNYCFGSRITLYINN